VAPDKQRPEYVPWLWLGGRLNRWYWQSPRRVLWWLVAAPIVGLVAAAVFLATGETVLGIVCVAGVVVGTVQAILFVPRAIRANREQR
jgi:hypothetical protein